MSESIEQLDEDALLSQLPDNVREGIEAMESEGVDWNSIGEALADAPSNAIPSQKGGGDWKDDLWEEVKAEFRIFLCTDDEKYSDLKDEGEDLGDMGVRLLVASLSSLIGSQIGVAGGMIAPLVVWLLTVGNRIGQEALCAQLVQQ